MHIALILDKQRLEQEHVLFRRVAIGLIGEGARLTRVVPDEIRSEAINENERRLALVPRLEVPMRVLPWMRRARTHFLADAFERATPDVIYASGRDAWAVGLDVAAAIDRPIALEVWSAELAAQAPRGRAAEHIGSYITPTTAIAAELRERVDPHLVNYVPTGIAVPTESHPIFTSPETAMTAAIVGSGRDVTAYRRVLRSLKEVLQKLPQLNVVIELRGPYEHEIWRELDRLNLRRAVSVIQDASQHRTLITQCDVLILPEAFGEVDSLMLDCMAVGMAVVAREDPYLDMLEDGTTAMLLKDDDPEQWTKTLDRSFTDLQLSRSIGRTARELTIKQHRSSMHVHQLVESFEKVVSGESYAFVPHVL